MDFAITLHRDELIRALRDFLPMRLLLGTLEGADDLAWVQIDAIETATFVPRRGLRMTCAALFHYPLPIVPDDFTVKHVSLEMIPAVVAGPDGPVLAFQLDVDELDIKYMPEFVDRSVAKRINAALIKYATTIAWNFSKTLTGIVNLPQRLEMVRTLELGAPEGRVEVTEDGIVIGLSVGVSFHHVGEVVVLDPPSPADDGSRQAEP